MKASVRVFGAAVAGLVVISSSFAQVKGPRSYFPKNYPAPAANGAVPPNGNQPPGAGGASNPATQPPKPPPAPKFKDVATNSQFFFLADTNHAFPWMKISSTTATNVKNGVVRPISPETPIQK